jgi:hypothetical protein
MPEKFRYPFLKSERPTEVSSSAGRSYSIR